MDADPEGSHASTPLTEVAPSEPTIPAEAAPNGGKAAELEPPGDGKAPRVEPPGDGRARDVGPPGDATAAPSAATEAPAPTRMVAATALSLPPDALTTPVGAPPLVLATTLEPTKEVVPWPIIWAAIGIVLAVGAAIELVLALQQVIEVLVISSFLAVVLSPAVSGLVRLKLRRGLATTIVFLLGMLAFAGLGYLLIHPLYQQAVKFANDLPNLLAKTQAGKGRLGELIAKYHLQNTAATNIPKIRHFFSHLGGPALTVARRVLSGLGGLVTVFIMTFLLLLEGPRAVQASLRLLPDKHAQRLRRVLQDVARSVTGYVIGNVATSVIAGIVVAIVLSVLNVPFAFVFGVWVAMVDLLPLVGGLLAGVPTVAFAALHSPTAGVITLIVFLVYQQVENHILNPLIMSRTVRLNPLWVILSVLAGAQLAGFFGALLAIPAAGAIHVIARDIWDERRGRLKVAPTTGEDHKPIA